MSTTDTSEKGLETLKKNAAVASRLLGEAVEAGMIVVRDPSVGTRSRTYLPYWAAVKSGDLGVVV